MENNNFKHLNQETENLSKISSEQIRQIVSKEKNNWKIVTIVLAICSILISVCVVISFVAAEISLGIFSVLLLFASIIILLYFIRTYKTRNDREWVLSYIKGKNSDASNIEIELLKQENIIDNDFELSKKVNILVRGWSSKKLLIDNQNKKFIYQNGKTYSKTYKFSDIINYEVYENGKTQVEGRAGSALIGGAFFGLGGLVVGSSMSRNINEKCSQLKLIIRLNDFYCPQIVINYIDNAILDKSDSLYINMRANLQSVCSMLEYMLNEKTLEQSSAIKQEEKTVATKTNKEQLQELKEMLDDGLITQEDFEQKKKQILGL